MRIVCALCACLPLVAGQFQEHTISTELKMGYQLVAADLNGDGRPDLIAVDERGTELAWFENPGWQRHVIASGVPRTINIDVWDMDRDGIPEIAIAYKFETQPSRSEGILALLRHDGDPRRPWTLTEFDRLPTAHRIRWADFTGDGRKVLVAAPMIGPRAEPPEYRGPVPIYFYRPGEWKRQPLTDRLAGVLHSIHPFDWDGRGHDDLLTASFLGLHVVRPAPGGGWSVEQLATGDPSPCPQCGSSEIKVARVGRHRILAAIEPWHGNQVVVYTKAGRAWRRHVLDDSFLNGHALAVGDLDGDGRDEIVAGFRGKGYQLYLYRALDGRGQRWRREVLDPGGIAAADCKIADYNGDGRPDVACIGAGTANLKWYENRGLTPP